MASLASTLAPARPLHREWIGWMSSVAGAVVLHLGIAAALLWDAGTRPADAIAPPMAAMTVELAPLPSAPQTPPSQMPPGPQQVEQHARPAPAPGRFDPPPQARNAPPDALPTKQDDTPQQASVDKTTDTPSSVADRRDAVRAPIEGAPSDLSSNAAQTWEGRLLAHLERFKRYPPLAQRRHQEDVVYLRFSMDRDGKVLSSKIQRSQGYMALDAEASTLLQRAAPLPPPPADMLQGDRVELVVPVEFFMRRYAQVRQ